MTTTAKPPRTTRRSRKAESEPAAPLSRLDQLAGLLTREGGATIAELTTATGWQPHSVRGAIAGALKKRGLAISSRKEDGVRRYSASLPA